MSARVSTQRNVVLGDFYGAILAGFYQYGSVSWKTFFGWLHQLFDTTAPWIIVNGDDSASEQFLPTDAVVAPGRYMLLAPDRSPLRVNLVPAHASPRQGVSPRVKKGELNLQHARDRDRAQSMTSGAELTWGRLQAAHIFSGARVHSPGRATSPLGRAASPPGRATSPPGRATSPSNSPATASSSNTRNALLQNMLLLREDLHSAWADYEFGINPDDGYRITPFVSGHADLAGLVLQVDDISDPATRPLDEPLRNHFLQGLLKHVKGHGERHWDFGIGALDLSDKKVWGTDAGKERLELEMENRLFDRRKEDA